MRGQEVIWGRDTRFILLLGPECLVHCGQSRDSVNVTHSGRTLGASSLRRSVPPGFSC